VLLKTKESDIIKMLSYKDLSKIKGCQMNESKHWTTHVEFMVLLVTLIGGFYLLDGKIERQSLRTDRLYEMFIDIVKEKK
jgi:hypothetical protein